MHQSPQVAPPTPLRENSCPRPPPAPEGVVISEVASGHWTNHSQQRAFVELNGPPMTDLLGLVLTVFDQERSGTVIALPLTGSIDQEGFYIVGNVTGAGEGRRGPCYSGTDDCPTVSLYPSTPSLTILLHLLSLLHRSDFPGGLHSAGTRSGRPVLRPVQCLQSWHRSDQLQPQRRSRVQ